MQNRRVVITRAGGPEVLQVITEELRPPQAGEAQVRVLASGVAYGDLFKRRGLGALAGSPKPPFTPGYDLVGTVEAVGPGVQRIKPGERVAAFVINGANTERINVSEDLLVRVPDGVDAVDGVCVILNYITAHQMLHRTARVRAGQSVLVHGAGGGVGTAVLELGRLAGLEMYGTASARKLPLVRDLGATAIDYKQEDFVERIRSLKDGGVDLVLDPIGGAHLAQSRRVLGRGGMLIVFGVAAALDGGLPAIGATFGRLLLYKLRFDTRTFRLYGIRDRAAIQADLQHLLGLLSDKKVHPVVGARLPLTQAAKAHEMLESAAVTGKIVLVPDE